MSLAIPRYNNFRGNAQQTFFVFVRILDYFANRISNPHHSKHTLYNKTADSRWHKHKTNKQKSKMTRYPHKIKLHHMRNQQMAGNDKHNKTTEDLKKDDFI